MLAKLFSKLFAMRALQEVPPAAEPLDEDLSHVYYYKTEISASNFFKEEYWPAVLQHFTHEKRLTNGTPLPTEEKRSLGLNPRMKVTREMVDVLTPAGMAYGPKRALETTYYRATHAFSRTRSISKMKNVGFKHFSPLSSGDQRDCDWCISVSKTLMPIDTDFEDLIHQHCTCTYCRCVLLARTE
jgi:hypothetical protein